MKLRTLLATGAVAASLIGPTTVTAQTVDQEPQTPPVATPAGSAEAVDIIVTAQRRSERVQDVPIPITVLSESTLERANVTNVLDLVKVTPSFTASRAAQASNTRLSIRGIGSGGNGAIEPSVGAFVDGIYIPRPGPLLAAINDIASVEVLRGPQGTLFGRNASVGAVSFKTAEPEHTFSGLLSAQADSFGAVNLNGRLNLPVSDAVATRFSVLYDHTDGFGRNAITGKRVGSNTTFSVRGGVSLDLSDNLRWLVRADYQHQTGDGTTPITVVADTVTPTAAANFNRILAGKIPDLVHTYSTTVRQITAGSLDDEQYGVSSDIKLDVGGGYSLRLLSGARKWTNNQFDQSTAITPADLFGRRSEYLSRSHSEELQFLTPAEKSLSAVAGLYYFRERYTIGTPVSLGADYCNIFIRNARPALLAPCLAGPQTLAATSNFNQLTNSYAAFGQATFKITPKLEITGGLRWTRDEKSATVFSANYNPAAVFFNAPDSANLAFDGSKLTYRLNTTYRILPSAMVYATYSTGYKSGGFDAGTGTTLGNRRVFRPELVKDIEVGFKSQWWDRRVTLNANYFRMDVDDFQLRAYDGTAFSIRNAGSIRQQGIEFETSVRPIKGLNVGVSGTRLGSEYTDFKNAPPLPGLTGVQDLTGQRVPFSPKWSGSANAGYETKIADDWSLNLSGILSFTSDVNVGTGGDGNPQGLQKGYSLLSLRVAVLTLGDRLEFALSGDNVTDERYCLNKNAQVLGGPLGVNAGGVGLLRCVLGEPRTIKGSARIRF